MLPFILIAGIAYGVSYWICSTGAPVWRAIVGFLIAFIAGWFGGVGIAVFLLSTFSHADTATTTFNLLKNGIAWALIGSSFGVYHGRKKLRTNCTLTQSPIPTPTQISPIDNALYAAALSEIEEGRLDKGVWARSFADSGGDEAKAKATYIRIRAEAIGLNAVWKNTQPHAVGNAETDAQNVQQPAGLSNTSVNSSWWMNFAVFFIAIIAVITWFGYYQNDAKQQAIPIQSEQVGTPKVDWSQFEPITDKADGTQTPQKEHGPWEEKYQPQSSEQKSFTYEEAIGQQKMQSNQNSNFDTTRLWSNPSLRNQTVGEIEIHARQFSILNQPLAWSAVIAWQANRMQVANATPGEALYDAVGTVLDGMKKNKGVCRPGQVVIIDAASANESYPVGTPITPI